MSKITQKLIKLRLFRKDEDGAVTVDWVVLSAAIVGLAAGGYASIEGATATLSTNVSTEVSSKVVANGD